MKNRHFTIPLLAFLVMFLLPRQAHASDVTVNSVSGTAGSNVSVSIMADFSQSTSSVQFNLQYDPQLLTVNSVTTGQVNSPWVMVQNSNTPGTVFVAMYNPGGAATALSGSQQQVAVIKFTVNDPSGVSTTSSALTISNVIFDGVRVTQLTSGTFTLNVFYALTVNETGSGTVTESPQNTTYAAGSQVTLTAMPATGYQFSNWSGSASGNANPLTLTMNANLNILASFILQTETITVCTGSGGTISPSGPVSINYGASQLFTLVPQAGYIAQLTVDGKVVNLKNNTYTLSNITTAHTVAASFNLVVRTHLTTNQQ